MNEHENLSLEFQQNVIINMMKEHLNNVEHLSVNLEQQQHDDEMPMTVVYRKRARIKFTQEQLNILEATFQEHRYPSIEIVDDLVERLHIPTQKITVWFQNRRARLKKTQQKQDDHRSYNSEIHLDEDLSRTSSTSPSSVAFLPPNPHPIFFNPPWQNFHYPFPSSTHYVPSYDFVNYHSPFVFHDMINSQ